MLPVYKSRKIFTLQSIYSYFNTVTYGIDFVTAFFVVNWVTIEFSVMTCHNLCIICFNIIIMRTIDPVVADCMQNNIYSEFKAWI